MKKRGSAKLVGEHTIEIIVAVLCILILVGLFVKLYLNWGTGYEEVLDKIDNKITYLKSSSYTLDYLYVTLYLPKKAGNNDALYLKNYKEGFFPEKECVGFYESCLCVCADNECSGAKKCKGFKDEIKISDFRTLIGSSPGFITGIPEGKGCTYQFINDRNEWWNNRDNSCIDLTGFTLAEGIQKLENSYPSLFVDGNPVEIIKIISVGTNIKIVKKGEIIEISKSDRQNDE